MLLIYTFMCMIIFLRILILSFQSHQICILSVGLGMAWNRDGLSCNTNPPASLTLLDVYIFKTVALLFEVCMAYTAQIDPLWENVFKKMKFMYLFSIYMSLWWKWELWGHTSILGINTIKETQVYEYQNYNLSTKFLDFDESVRESVRQWVDGG